MLLVRENINNPVMGGGPFHVSPSQPGRILNKNYDFAFGALARIDHANANVGTLVPMHQHKNDEILSYIWKGEMIHEDSTGKTVAISPNNLMLMNAGRSFYHEESVPNKDVEMMQIFIRPEEKDLEPSVQFMRRDHIEKNKWNLIAGPKNSDADLILNQNMYFYDLHLSKGDKISIPYKEGYTQLIYIMDGEATINNKKLIKKTIATDLDNYIDDIEAKEDTTITLFLIDMNAPETNEGMFSGIQM